MISFDLNILSYSVLIGVLYAGLGYMKNRSREDFDIVKFMRTIGVGAFVGVVAPYVGLDLATFDFENVATTAGLIFFIQTTLQALVRRK